MGECLRISCCGDNRMGLLDGQVAIANHLALPLVDASYASCGVDISALSVNEVKRTVVPLMKEQGVGVASLAAPIGYQTISDGAAFTEQLEQLRHVCDLADTLGCRWIRVGTFCPDGSLGHQDASLQVFDCLTKVVEVCRINGMRVLVANHHGHFASTSERCKRLGDYFGSNNLQFAFSFAEFLQAGFKPLCAYKQLEAFIACFQIDDYSIRAQHSVACCTGDGWVAEVVQLACSNGFSGWLSIPLRSEGLPGMREDLSALQRILENRTQSNTLQ